MTFENVFLILIVLQHEVLLTKETRKKVSFLLEMESVMLWSTSTKKLCKTWSRYNTSLLLLRSFWGRFRFIVTRLTASYAIHSHERAVSGKGQETSTSWKLTAVGWLEKCLYLTRSSHNATYGIQSKHRVMKKYFLHPCKVQSSVFELMFKFLLFRVLSWLSGWEPPFFITLRSICR